MRNESLTIFVLTTFLTISAHADDCIIGGRFKRSDLEALIASRIGIRADTIKILSTRKSLLSYVPLGEMAVKVMTFTIDYNGVVYHLNGCFADYYPGSSQLDIRDCSIPGWGSYTPPSAPDYHSEDELPDFNHKGYSPSDALRYMPVYKLKLCPGAKAGF